MNPTYDTDCNVKPPVTAPVNMKQSVRHEVCHVNAGCNTQYNVKHTSVCESGNGKHTCEALPNVKPVSSNDGADHGLNQSVYDSLDA